MVFKFYKCNSIYHYYLNDAIQIHCAPSAVHLHHGWLHVLSWYPTRNRNTTSKHPLQLLNWSVQSALFLHFLFDHLFGHSHRFYHRSISNQVHPPYLASFRLHFSISDRTTFVKKNQWVHWAHPLYESSGWDIWVRCHHHSRICYLSVREKIIWITNGTFFFGAIHFRFSKFAHHHGSLRKNSKYSHYHLYRQPVLCDLHHRWIFLGEIHRFINVN